MKSREVQTANDSVVSGSEIGMVYHSYLMIEVVSYIRDAGE